MRIISGKHKGKFINVDTKFTSRPTTDLAKESLFNILNNYFYMEEIDVLDLYSGTGSISYEFASRGAISVISVEQNPTHQSFIKRTSLQLELNQIISIKANALSFLKNTNNKFDIIFADPPFDCDDFLKIPESVFEKNLLKENGWLIIEHADRIKFNNSIGFFDNRSYGRIQFSFFKNI